MPDQNNSNNQTQNTQQTTSNKGLVAASIVVLAIVFIFTLALSFRSEIISFLNDKYNLSINESEIEQFLNNKKTNIYQLTPVPKVPQPTQSIIQEASSDSASIVDAVFSDDPIHSTEILPEYDEQTAYQPAIPSITPSPKPTFPENAIATIQIGNELDMRVNPLRDLPVFDICDASIGDVVFFGSYEQDNDLSNGPEPIAWYVIDKKEDRALLMTVYILDNVRYHNEYTYTTWEKCLLRSWLNNDFYQSAFSDDEKQYVLLSDNENKTNPYAAFSHDFDNTQDYCFALSVDELYNLFNEKTWNEGSYYFGMGETGKSDYRFYATMTRYAFAQGVGGYNYMTETEVKIDGDPSEFSNEYDPGAHCNWWLRTLGTLLEDVYDGFVVAYAGSAGACAPTGRAVNDEYINVRPAIWIKTNE